jgi:hypothetical protein
MQEDLALMQRFADELVLLIIELYYCLLEVPHASVDEFGRFGGRPCIPMMRNVIKGVEVRRRPHRKKNRGARRGRLSTRG